MGIIFETQYILARYNNRLDSLGMIKKTGLALALAGTIWAGGFVKPQAGEEVTGELIVRLKPGREIAETAHQRLGARFRNRWTNLRMSHLRLVQVDAAEMEAVGAALAADPAVDLVEPNRILHIGSLAAPNDPNFASGQPNLTLVRALEAWRLFPGRYLTSTLSLDRVRVAVLDTGADCTHPDFANAGGSSANTTAGGQINFARSSAIRATTTPSPACTWQDDNGHGTHVSGIAGAATNNTVGIASLGNMVELMVIKLADSAGATNTVDVANAITTATDQGARVINLSLIGGNYSQTMQDAVDYAWARNVLVIGAAGNSGAQTLSFPGASNHVVGVGAVNSDGAIASFSTRGSSIDIVAPGVNIYSLAPTYTSTRGNLTYATISGTSMAAPHVAALAGMVMMASPGIAADAVVARIQRAAELATDGWSSDYGYGYINAERAISGSNFRTATLGGVVGQVQDTNGLAITGATVTLNSIAVVTTSNGLFRFSAIAPGDYTMTVAAPSQTTLSVPVTVAAGFDTPTHLRVGRSYGTFTGTLTAGGSPVAGAVVQGLQGGLVQGVAVTNASGVYRLFVPSGTYEIRGGGFYQSLASADSRTVSSGGTTSVDLTAQNFGRLEGAIRNSGNATVAGAQIVLASPSRSVGAVSDGSGNYLTIPSPAGTYSATAATATAASNPANVAIVSNTTSRLDMVLWSATDPVILNPASLSIGPVGGSSSVGITTNPSNLAWTATTASAWIALGSTTSGTGNGTLNFTIAPNPETSGRSGSIQINGVVFNITQSAASGTVTPSPTSLNVGAASGSGTIQVTGSGEWVAASQASWITITGSGTGTGNGSFGYSIAANAGAARNSSIRINGQSITVAQQGAGGGGTAISLDPTSATYPAAGGGGTILVTTTSSWTAVPSASWITINSGGSATGNGSINYTVAANASTALRTGSIQVGSAAFSITQNGTGSAGSGLEFIPITPCRIADTREDMGDFGRPVLAAGVTRDFVIPSSSCGIPSTARAYSLNVTAVPRGPLGYLTIWPSGSARPQVSTLNAIDGRVKANAAIVAAGANGGVSLFAADPTDVILDINGYFVDAGSNASGLAYYPLTACRLFDTRSPGGSLLSAGESRSFALRSLSCNIPSTARAYSLNATVVPSGPLGYITLWPTGQQQPFVSTLNAPTGGVVANAAIVPAGTNGDVSVFVQGNTHLVMDINGYFAPPGSAGGQRFYPVTPCRLLDSREPNGPAGGPAIAGGQSRAIAVTSGNCGIPSTATGFSLNATVVPTSVLGFLTMWPTGQTQPFVSTLNALDDRIVANAVLVGAGTGGAVSAFAADQTHLILDTNGYFAP